MDEKKYAVNFGDNTEEVISTDEYKIIKLKNDSGEGYMTLYEVFPGAIIIFHDYNMSYCESKFKADNDDILCIEHCREGGLRYKVDSNTSYFFKSGDLTVDDMQNHSGMFEYPLKHFSGVAIGFYLSVAEEQLKKEFKDFSISLYGLKDKFCSELSPYVINGRSEIEHIMSELYSVPEKIRKDYFRIKIFELLLYLDALEFDDDKKLYFYKSQVEKIHAVEKFLTGNLTMHYSISDLSHKFKISETALKKCFKTVYGNPINTYMQEYRMNTAAVMLTQERDLSVSEIAGLVGYDSPSSFTVVFKKIMGISPLEYRKKVCSLK